MIVHAQNPLLGISDTFQIAFPAPVRFRRLAVAA